MSLAAARQRTNALNYLDSIITQANDIRKLINAGFAFEALDDYARTEILLSLQQADDTLDDAQATITGG